jgi:hypothetical protein
MTSALAQKDRRAFRHRDFSLAIILLVKSVFMDSGTMLNAFAFLSEAAFASAEIIYMRKMQGDNE